MSRFHYYVQYGANSSQIIHELLCSKACCVKNMLSMSDTREETATPCFSSWSRSATASDSVFMQSLGHSALCPVASGCAGWEPLPQALLTWVFQERLNTLPSVHRWAVAAHMGTAAKQKSRSFEWSLYLSEFPLFVLNINVIMEYNITVLFSGLFGAIFPLPVKIYTWSLRCVFLC